MSHLRVPSQNDLMWPSLKSIKEIGGLASIQEIEAKVIDLMNYSDEMTSVMHTNTRSTELAYRLAWARTMLKDIGAIENSSRGIWSITEKGENLDQKTTLSLYKTISDKYQKQVHHNIEPNEYMEEKWLQELLDVLKSMHPSAFEKLAQRILRESDFVSVDVTGKSGDGGIDGKGILNMNLISFQVFFQCKRYTGVVGSPDLRNFRGAIQGRGDKGLFITTGVFSAEAQKEATRDGAPTIDLIDGNDLCKLLKKLQLGVKTEMVENIIINPEYFASI